MKFPQTATLALALAVAACSSRRFESATVPEQDRRRAVLAALLQHAELDTDTGPVLAFATTIGFRALPADNWLRFRKDTAPRVLEAALEERSRDRMPLDASIFPSAVRLVDRDLGLQLAERGLGGTKVLGVSPIVFAADGSAALVYYEIRCGPVCGTGIELWLERDASGRWRVRQELAHWYG